MSGKTIAVRLVYGDARPAYAKGGLVNAALAVKRAGRYGDTEIIHVNKAELAELSRRWGPPTINPETGQPEFFLGFLKKLLPIAAIAANFIPGVGPAISMGLGAASGALNGGGIKGALLGALPGVLGGGLGSLGVKGALGAGLPGLLGKTAATAAVPGAVAPTIAAAAPTVAAAAPTVAPAAAAAGSSLAASVPGLAEANAAGQAMSVAPQVAAANAAPQAAAAAAAKPGFWNQNFLGLPIKNKLAIPGVIGGLALSGAFKTPTTPTTAEAQQAQADFKSTFNNNQMVAPQSRFTVPLQQGAPRAAADYARAGYEPEYQYFNSYADGGEVDKAQARVNASTRRGSDYGVTLPVGDNSLSVDALSNGMIPSRLALALSRPVGQGRLDLNAQSDRGIVPNRFGARYTLPFSGGGDVDGDGDGRADKIDARLSDGEYVMDAETVAMLGNGSNKAGAKALDSLRVNLRKQKGAKLAKGKFSPRAKQPAAYMRGAA
jgi:hypothetical protein